MIQVKHLAGDEWLVSVQGAVTTHHRVRVTKADVARLSEGRTPEGLLQESFRFLLEREPNRLLRLRAEMKERGRAWLEFRVGPI